MRMMLQVWIDVEGLIDVKIERLVNTTVEWSGKALLRTYEQVMLEALIEPVLQYPADI